MPEPRVGRAYSPLVMRWYARNVAYCIADPPQHPTVRSTWIDEIGDNLSLLLYFDHFSRDQIKFLTFEEMISNTSEVFKSIFRWFNLDDSVPIPFPQPNNVTPDIVAQPILSGLLHRLRQIRSGKLVGAFLGGRKVAQTLIHQRWLNIFDHCKEDRRWI